MLFNGRFKVFLNRIAFPRVISHAGDAVTPLNQGVLFDADAEADVSFRQPLHPSAAGPRPAVTYFIRCAPDGSKNLPGSAIRSAVSEFPVSVKGIHDRGAAAP